MRTANDTNGIRGLSLKTSPKTALGLIVQSNQEANGEEPGPPATKRNIDTPAKVTNSRLAREWKTVTAMIHIYCRDQHGADLCSDCQDLTRYVSARLDHCRFGEDKPTCAKCPVHCYQRERRETIKAVMRYAGPRMLREHPWLCLRHLLDGWFSTASPSLRHKAKTTPGILHLNRAPVL